MGNFRRHILFVQLQCNAKTPWTLLTPGLLYHCFVNIVPEVKHQHDLEANFKNKTLVLEFPMLLQDKDYPHFITAALLSTVQLHLFVPSNNEMVLS